MKKKKPSWKKYKLYRKNHKSDKNVNFSRIAISTPLEVIPYWSNSLQLLVKSLSKEYC